MSESQNTLTPKAAWEMYENEGMTNGEIADRFDVSESTVSRRRHEYEEMKETAQSEVEKQVEDLDIGANIEDEEPEDNPFDVVACPECSEDMLPPNEPGEKTCPNCEVRLHFSEDETR